MVVKVDQINGFGLKNIIKVPTRLNKNGGSLIDHFYCSCPEKITNSYVLISDISDHFPLYVKLKNCKLIKNNSKNRTKYIQDFSKINSNKLLNDASKTLNRLETDKIIKSKISLNTKFNYLIDKIKEITEQNVPTKKISKAKLKLKSKPWITRDILKSIKKKNKLYKNLCKNTSINPVKLKEYKKYRNKLTRTITNSKKHTMKTC